MAPTTRDMLSRGIRLTSYMAAHATCDPAIACICESEPSHSTVETFEIESHVGDHVFTACAVRGHARAETRYGFI